MSGSIGIGTKPPTMSMRLVNKLDTFYYASLLNQTYHWSHRVAGSSWWSDITQVLSCPMTGFIPICS